MVFGVAVPGGYFVPPPLLLFAFLRGTRHDPDLDWFGITRSLAVYADLSPASWGVSCRTAGANTAHHCMIGGNIQVKPRTSGARSADPLLPATVENRTNTECLSPGR